MALAVGLILGAGSAQAATYEVLVAPRDTAAQEKAAGMADGSAVFAARKIHSAFAKAQELLAGCGDCTVHVKIAGGSYVGKARTGQWTFPDVQAPGATLRILGGYAEDFSTRDPFASPTILQVSENRSDAVLRFEGKKHALRELVVSGLTIDTSPSNSYGAQGNSLHKGGSSSFPMLALGYLTTERLVISDNVFMNAPNSVAGPLIRAMSPEAEVRVENNVFFNNVYTWVVGSGGGKHIPGRYVIAGNSFVRNWPYNPDRNTSNPGTIEIGNKYSAARVEIRGNLFAYNAGGAVHPQWDDTEGPKIAFLENLFYRNGQLFEPSSTASGAIVGKFNGSATHSVFDMIDVEDDFNWEARGNVSMDPGLTIKVPKLKGVTYEGQARRGAPTRSADAAGSVEASSEETGSEETGSEEEGSALEGDPASAEVDELERMMAELDALSAGDEAKEEASADAETADAEADAEAEAGAETEEPIFDEAEFDFDFEEEYAGEGAVENYAPFLEFTPGRLPFPTRAEAREFGASPERVRQY